MKKYAFLFCIMTSYIMYSCTYQNEEEVFGTDDPDPGPTVVSLSDDIVPIMNSSCAIPGCHVAGSQFPNLSVKNTIISQADRIRVRTRVGGGMPRTGSITNAERDLIADWVDQGAMDN